MSDVSLQSESTERPGGPRIIGYVNLHVRDFARSVAFFRDVIGFPLMFADEGFHFARFGGYASSSAFIAAFRKQFGCRPARMR